MGSRTEETEGSEDSSLHCRSKKRSPTIIIYTTCKDKTEARKIAKALLDERLVTCANIFPCTSLYRWEGRLCDESECAMLMKTRPAHWQKLQRRIKELHSYDLPCIERIEAKASREFEAWIQAETGHAG